MFLHLITDEKFIDGAITRFNRIDPGNHLFLLIHNEDFTGCRYIRQIRSIEMVLVGSGKYQAYLSDLSGYTGVFVHSLFNPCAVEMVINSPPGTNFIWLFWGGELWFFEHIRRLQMLPKTQRLYRYNKTKNWIKVNLQKYTGLFKQADFKAIFNTLRKRTKRKSFVASTNAPTIMEKAIRRMRYIIPVVREDADVLMNHFQFRPGILEWNYSMGIPLDTLKARAPKGNNLLVGNSAHYSNNHLDIFKWVRRIKQWDGDIVVPLSYGDSEYRDYIIRNGTKMFGRRFMPLKDFLPVEEYFAVLAGCSYAAFNTVRQQALGNIAVLMCRGTKVFLREENPVYQFFKRNNTAVFSIQEEIEFGKKNPFVPITDEIAVHNHLVMRFLYGEEALDSKTKQLLTLLSSIQGK